MSSDSEQIYDAEEVSKSIVDDPGVLRRLSTLSRTLSQLNSKQMAQFRVDINDFNLSEVLSYLKHRQDELGIAAKSVGVELRDVSVLGANTAASYIVTAGDFFGAPIMLPYRKLRAKTPAKISKQSKNRQILKNVNVNVNSGEMCLVLGRPGAGCSTLLKTIAGETQLYSGVTGEITYNNIDQEEMIKTFKRNVIYNPELDIHFPHLTVDQTLRFAIGCRTPNLRIDNFSREDYITTMRDLWVTVFGLNHALNTKVGNDFVHGISGGERKRVSICEAIITQGSLYCWDNVTRGLDSSTALEFTQAIRTSTNLLNLTSFATIYQAGENIYQLFDKVTVLYDGIQIFFGPVDRAREFFVEMGFEPHARQSTPEFLTAITDPNARFPKKGYELKVPRTAAEFENYWLHSEDFQVLQLELVTKKATADPISTRENMAMNLAQEKMSFQRKKSQYTINVWEQLKLCVTREFNNTKGNSAFTVINTVVAFAVSLIIGSLFYDLPNSTSGMLSRSGVLFFSVLYFASMGLAGVVPAFANRPILMRQQNYMFYHPSLDILSSVIVGLPIQVFSTILFAVVIYFLSDLKREPGPFFTFVLFINLTAQVINALFQMFLACLKTVASALALCGLNFMSMVLYCSYMIQRPSMVPWFKWYSYINPLLYGFEAMITTEFHGRRMECTNLVPAGPGFESVSPDNQVCGFTASNGQVYVDGDYYMHVSFDYSFNHVWRNFGILILFFIGFLSINCIISEHVKPILDNGDHLFFIRGGNIPDDILLDEEIPVNDPESQSSDALTPIQQQFYASRKSRKVSTTLGSQETFIWQHVDYTIPYENAQKKLLDDIQGYVKPGTITLLMGESGAGKTTLLNVLSQRVDIGVIDGSLLVDGVPTTSSFNRRTGYVQQQDIHIPELTVRESLQFAARLRRPISVPELEKLEYVEKVIQILRMESYADAIAGKPGLGLNVEQRKKLSIATEMVTKPELLLFLDEPTSGLDSQSSWSIVQVLRDLAEAGQLILCTIHQPSLILFEQFDRLLLLQKGGQTVYFGDIGENSETILKYFRDRGARECKGFENPAEYILEIIGAGATLHVEEDWNEIWINSEEYQDVTEEIDDLIHSKKQKHEENMAENETQLNRKMPYFYQFKFVLQRVARQFYRDIVYIRGKFILMTLGALLAGFSFFNIKHTVIGMQNAVFAVFISLIVAFPLSNQIQGKAITSRALFEARELKSNTYHWSVLPLSFILSEIPYLVVFSSVYFTIWYCAIQFDNLASRMGYYWLMYCVMFQLFYISLALWVLFLSPDLPSANVILTFLYQFVLAFSGFLQSESLMPRFWTFMYRVSPYTYLIQSFVSTVLHNRRVECSSTEFSYLDPPSGSTCGEFLDPFLQFNTGYITNENLTSNCEYCPYSYGDEYFAIFGINFDQRYRNFGLMWVYFLFNTSAMIFCFWLFRIHKFSLPKLFKSKKTAEQDVVSDASNES